jgi:hypothetical protein
VITKGISFAYEITFYGVTPQAQNTGTSSSSIVTDYP